MRYIANRCFFFLQTQYSILRGALIDTELCFYRLCLYLVYIQYGMWKSNFKYNEIELNESTDPFNESKLSLIVF